MPEPGGILFGLQSHGALTDCYRDKNRQWTSSLLSGESTNSRSIHVGVGVEVR